MRSGSVGMGNAMKVAEIVRADGSQLVKLPEAFHLEGDTVSIRRQGEAIALEPIKPARWPLGFFESIRIDDPAFARLATTVAARLGHR